MIPVFKQAPSGAGLPLRRWTLVLLGGLLLSVGTVLGWLKWHEDELVFKAAISQARVQDELPAMARRVAIAVGENALLSGIVLPAERPDANSYWILHLHGNADSAFSTNHLDHMQRLAAANFNVMGFDYRGFGLSPGLASEEHLYEDAEAVYQALRRFDVPDNRIILWGHSLGTGPAVYLATKHPVAALVLFGAFTSIPDAAADTYPFLPVRGLVGIQLDSRRRLPDVHVPVFIAHSRADLLVPFRHAERNFAAANEPKRLLPLDFPSDDGFGGHVDALYEHLDVLLPALRALGGAAR